MPRPLRTGTHDPEGVESIEWLTGSSGLRLTEVLMDRGLTTRNIQGLVKSGQLVRLRRGCYRLDFAWEGITLALEFDGRTKYFDYAPTSEVLCQERQTGESPDGGRMDVASPSS